MAASNQSAPCDVSRWQRELTALGRIGDRPRFILSWGQEARHFAAGGIRIKYPTDEFIEKKVYAYYLRDPEGNLEQVTYREARENRRLDRLPMSYLASHEVEFIGEARWFVEEFWTVKDFGSREDWERNRYRYFDEREELWRNRQFDESLGLWKEDTLGPFPNEGRYEFFLRVETEKGRYRPPGADTIERVRKEIQKRDAQKETLTAQQKVTGFYRKVEEYDMIEAEAITKRVTQELLKDLRPIVAVPDIH